MGDILSDAVGAAFGAVASALPRLSVRMSAGGAEGNALLCSSNDLGMPSASSSTVNGARRVVVQASEFQDLAISQTVELDGEKRIITGLKNTGEAAFFLDLSQPLEAVVFVCKVGGRTARESVMCAVVDDYAHSDTIGSSVHSVSGDSVTVFIPLEEWNGDEQPNFGTRMVLKGGRKATVQSVERNEYAWCCQAVVNMMEGDR